MLFVGNFRLQQPVGPIRFELFRSFPTSAYARFLSLSNPAKQDTMADVETKPQEENHGDHADSGDEVPAKKQKLVEETQIFDKGEDCKDNWKDAKADYDEKDEHLEIMGKPVMERWETPYMHKLATIATSKGREIAEIILYREF